ncbi:VF530 family protein [Shewanella sp. Isolate11]|uniref:VF530 family protein n=1 Tax=Shewanella sp. Isolate11 TaxID=2908530 RepID=UPI001EFD9E57|nr:VF530 family protein [Shewanella sp. Isolate11]MCG9696278.1 VF530 family protein [Shewanella sp. Isolate11]
MTQANNPLHGIKLADLLNDLVDHYGWEELGARIDIRCFNHDPSIKSSLKFLRKTPWAREKVEYLYLKMNNLPLPAPKPYAETGIKDKAVEDKPSGINADIWGKNQPN